MVIKADAGVRRLANKKYRNVTNEVKKANYPTKHWQSRYSQAVYGGR